MATAAIAQPLLNPISLNLSGTVPLDSTFPLSTEVTPITQNGRIELKDGHFFTRDGKRVRMFGTILSGEACFPDSATAIIVAAKLRALGFNAVRMKNFDYSASNSNSILQNTSTGNSNGFDSNQVKRLDWFIYQLKQNGVYVNLCLHSNRTARSGDAIPRRDSLPANGVIMNYFEPALQSEYKKFVARLLNLTNRYTGVQYKNEPAIALLDLDEGNSLYISWINNHVNHRSDGGSSILSFNNSRYIDTLWTRWLLTKYTNEAGIRAAWTFTPQNLSNVIKLNGGFEPDLYSSTWIMSAFAGGANAVVERDQVDKKEGTYSLKIIIATPGTAETNIQYYNNEPVLQKYAQYEVKFWAKTNVASRTARFVVGNLSVRDTLTTAWKEYSYRFRSSVNGATRFTVQAGGQNGTIWIDDVRVTAQVETPFITGDTVSTFKLRRLRYDGFNTFPHKRWMDVLQFYHTAMERYNQNMIQYIKDSLQCAALVSTQNSISNANDIYAMRFGDFTTATTQWDFRRRIPNSPSDTMWYVLNDAMLANKTGGLIANATRAKIKDKPLVINAHTMPFPYENINELSTLTPFYYAYHDADGYFLNYYSATRPGLTSTTVSKNLHYEMSGNSPLNATIPFASYLFKNGLIQPAQTVIPIRHTAEAISAPTLHQFGSYFLESNNDNRIPLFRRTEIDSFAASLQTFRPQLEIPALADPNGIVNTRNLISDTEELLWNADDTLFTAITPRAVVLNGVLRGKVLQPTNDLSIERKDNGRFGTIAFVSADTLPINESPNIILTLSTRAANVNAQWDGDSTTYRNWGLAEIQTEAMGIDVSMRSQYDSLLIFPLDSLGRRRSAPIYATKSGSRFRFSLNQAQQRSYWYSIIGKRDETVSVERTVSDDFMLFAPTPNIINSELRVECSFGAMLHHANISLIAPDGAETPLWNGLASDYINTSLNTSTYPSGMYRIVARCANQIRYQHVIILH
ncbi:MAG: hypothetical protein JNL32_07990 [Candidatus Kapabacteria bacterium]|nr:hypothetical protein [Candidatus Kapabacteria bacterium]